MPNDKQSRAELVEIGREEAALLAEGKAPLNPQSVGATIGRLVAAFEALEAENARLREALRPFAEYMGDMDKDSLGNPLPDGEGVGWVYLTQGDFRRARAALGGKP